MASDTGLIDPSKKRKLPPSDQTNGETKKKKKSRNDDELKNGAVIAADEAKAARKAEKRRLKAEKKAAQDADHSIPETGVVDGNAELAASTPHHDDERVARKAEKKRLKELKRAQNGVAVNDSEDSKPLNGIHSNHTKPIRDSHISSLEQYTESSELASLPQTTIDEYLTKQLIAITDPKNTRPLRPIIAFSQLPSTVTKDSTPFIKFTTPTPIQSATWPFILAGRDVIGIAETGSGKTLAFGVPLIQHITSTKSTTRFPARAVIVSPTRELAVQIYEQIEALAKLHKFHAVCIYGGVPKEPQKEGLKIANVIVATPGRLNDLLEEGSADISKVDYLVLDEADRMLDKGFEEEIKRIISGTLPTEKRQTLMFTATWPQSVRSLASTFMKDAVKITIGDHASGELRANNRIEQRVEVLDTHPRTKETRLLQLIKEIQTPRKKSGDSEPNRVLVFALYKKEAARIEQFLHQRGHNVAGIHGDLSQDRRTAALNGFRAGTTPLLVATDVAARGLDIPAVKAVINLTFPLTVEDYVHRIGRTGRAGSNGLAITFFTEHDKALAGGLVNVLRAANQPVPEELLKFGGTVKKKQHDAYGAFYKAPVGDKKATKVKFDD